ncbi:MAG TPA: hypothetical protein PLB41_08900 [Rubrivivax sp.]|nr:hypothetical protein [Rubrivivax sp.]
MALRAISEDLGTPRRWAGPGAGPSAAGPAAARRGNPRRLLVFALTLLAALLIGQAWNFSRPAQFRSSTRLQVSLPEVGRPGLSASAAYASRLQLFDSRPVLTRLAQALLAAGLPAAALGTDAAGQLQSMLQVLPVPGSEVVELRATGTEPRLLADILNTLPEVLRQELASRQLHDADAQLAAARQELARLEHTASQRRARLDAFRQREGVFAQREDNEAVARSQGLGRALDAAVEKEAAAAARLAAVSKAVEQGRSSTQARADPALSGLETRAHQTREELKELERTYTPEFLAMDPQARALRARLAELEVQIVQQRDISLRAALQAAQEEHAGAQAQVSSLRAQLGATRPALTKTSSRMAEAKLLEDDLAQVDKARRDLLERVSRLEADEQRRVATVTVVEAASVPTSAFGPPYVRDAMLVSGAALALALLMMAIVEAFNRPGPVAPAEAHTTVLLSPAWPDPRTPLASHGAPALTLADAAAPVPLAAPLQVLSQPEAAALLTAGRGSSRLLCALALLGLSVDEALAVRPRDLDREALRLQVGGPWARQLPLPRWLADALPDALPDARQGGAEADGIVLHDAAGQALSAADLASMLTGAALDAHLDHSAAIGWNVLRDTAIDWLVGQGIRYTDLPQAVGRVDADKLQALASRHGESRRRELVEIDRLMPALQLDPGA